MGRARLLEVVGQTGPRAHESHGGCWELLLAPRGEHGPHNTVLLLLLSHFSHARLCATPSLGFSRQEHWSGLPFPSPVHKSESENEVTQSCLTLRDPMDCSLPGSSIHGIFQARVLEWGATAFSGPPAVEI